METLRRIVSDVRFLYLNRVKYALFDLKMWWSLRKIVDIESEDD